MNVNDLMIGDWVDGLTSTHTKRCVAQIEAIEEYHSLLVKKENVNWFLDKDDIKPIPIKRIHLTKNGFVATNAKDDEFVYYDGYEIKVIFDGGILDTEPFISLSIKFAEKELWMQVEYVHELQHAMRLLGVEKEIKL